MKIPSPLQTPDSADATRFRQAIIDVHGDAGRRWLDDLPSLLQWCADRWGLAFESTHPLLSYNHVSMARRTDGSRVALKLGVPSPPLLNEIHALELYHGFGAVQLIECDHERGALLLDRAEPGRMLSELAPAHDERATLIAAEVMMKLWRPAPIEHTFPTIADWGRGFERLREEFAGATGPFPALLVDRAEGLFRDLLDSMATPVLLHGDLHHFNILSHGDDWLAIDPQGVVGEAAYEVGALLRNPMPEMVRWSDLQQMLQRRIDVLAERLQIDRKRIHGWGLAQAVLSGWWSYEDHGAGWEGAIHVAELLADIEP